MRVEETYPRYPRYWSISIHRSNCKGKYLTRNSVPKGKNKLRRTRCRFSEKFAITREKLLKTFLCFYCRQKTKSIHCFRVIIVYLK